MRKRKREVGERKKGEKSGKKGKNGKKKRNQEQALEKRDRARSRWRMRKQEEMNIYRGARFLSMKEERKDLKSVESGTGMKRNFMGEEGGTGMKKLSSSSSSSSRFNRICVFCGSSSSKRASYKDVAIELGKELILRNIDLIYGGESIGLMGLVSDTIRTGGQHILGVIHKSLMSKEITGGIAGDVRVVSNMHERKAEMVRVVDAFIALPRGYGILQELFEVITWAQLGIHSMPVGVLNVDGYYDLNLSFIDSAVVEEFISSKTRCILISAPSPKELLKKLEKYVPERDEIVTQLNWDVEVLGSDVSGSDSEPGNQLFESSS